jgi:tetratricopeptide (TPR) repeat protein
MRSSVLALCLGLSFTLPAWAEVPAAPAEPAANDGARAEADALFEEGRKLVQAGQIGAACKKLTESYRLRPGIGVLFNLADCNERLGKTGTAYQQYKEVLEKTQEAGQAEREKVAKERVAALEPKLVRLVLTVPPGAKLEKVTLAGVLVPPDRYNQPMIVDPGEHLVRAEGPNDKGEPFEATVLLEQEGSTATVAIPVGEGPKMKRKVGYIVAGSIVMGVGALAAAGGALAAAQGQDQSDDAMRAGGIGLALGGLAVGAGVGVPLFVIGLKKRPVENVALAPFEPSVLPEVAIGPTSADLRWTF